MKCRTFHCEVCGWQGKLEQLEVSGFKYSYIFLLKYSTVRRVRRQPSPPSPSAPLVVMPSLRVTKRIACGGALVARGQPKYCLTMQYYYNYRQ